MDMEISTIAIIVGVALVVAVTVVMKALFNTNKEPAFQEKTEETEAKKIFKLFNYEGTLIKEYRDVYVTHWDKNIYHLSYENKGEPFIRIDKGDTMLLTVEEPK